jgi:hypothetical protein
MKNKRKRVSSARLLRSIRAENREMRSILIRIHSARIAMSHSGIMHALDDVDRFFGEPNCN